MKTKMTHTPVIVEVENAPENFEDSIRIKWKSYTSNGVPVFTIQHYPARLIAAAPDMKTVVDLCAEWFGLEDRAINQPHYERSNKIRAALRAAIAKAR